MGRELRATPSSLSSVAGQAASGDTIIMEAGTYGNLPQVGGVTYRAVDWREGKVVSPGKVGHLGEGMAVKLTPTLSLNKPGMAFEGIFFDTRGSSSINACLVGAHDIAFRDTSHAQRPNSGARQIGITVGSGSIKVTGFKMQRSRIHPTGQAGQKLDHALYLKRCTGALVEDVILHDAGRFPLHLYTDCDLAIFRRVLIWGSVGCITFSGASDSSTGVGGYATSDQNLLVDSILGQAQIDMVGNWTSGAPTVGNRVEHNMFWKGTGSAPYPPNSMAGVTFSQNVQRDPGFKDWKNGDFGRVGTYDGFGPAYLFGAVTPPPPPPPPPDPEPTLHELLINDFTAIRNRLMGVEEWTNLTQAQRESIIAARNRAQIGIDRLLPPTP